MLIVSWVCSLLVGLVAAVLVYRRQPMEALGVLLAGAVVPCGITLLLPGHLIGLGLGFVVVLVGGLFNRSPRSITLGLFASVLIGHVAAYLIWVRADLQTLDRLRTDMPILPPDDRLTRPASPSLTGEPQPNQTTNLDESVVVLREGSASRVVRNLKLLHEDHLRGFLNSAGFGVMRMNFAAPTNREAYLPERVPVPQPHGVRTSQRLPDVDHPATIERLHHACLHANTVVEFTFPQGWGYEQQPDRYVGFLPHQLGTEAYGVEYQPWHPDKAWRVATIELIGLLAHPKPTVYQTENLPRMDEAKSAPTRDPDDFEAAGLKAVADGEELYLGTGKTEPVLRVVGGIRAAKSCIPCHGCRHGELLGAFSYVLRRAEK